MSGDTSGPGVVERVREACATELDRLGSEKAIVAGTGAALEPEPVLGWAADTAVRGAVVFEAWADDEGDDDARAAFAEAAATEREHVARLVELGAPDPDEAASDPLHEQLRGLDDTTARVGGGLIGRPLVVSRRLLQVVNFFVNEAAETEADAARDLRADAEARIETGAALLGTVGGDSGEAVAAATAAVEAAYREYADALEGMGIDPRPVC